MRVGGDKNLACGRPYRAAWRGFYLQYHSLYVVAVDDESKDLDNLAVSWETPPV
jgi:hypothetical protein